MFKGDYLRVLSPKTTNGINLKLDEDDRVEYKETFLPLTAKKALEEQNKKLPDHLKKKIEPVYSGIETEQPEGQQYQPMRKKPGPKPKNR
jgi:hypothetical protein